MRRDYDSKVHSGEYPPQKTLAPLYPYQREGMLYLAFTGRALLADEMGLGKTIRAIAACVLLHRLAWARHGLYWSSHRLLSNPSGKSRSCIFTPLPSRVVFGNKRERIAAYDAPSFFTLVNYRNISWLANGELSRSAHRTA